MQNKKSTSETADFKNIKGETNGKSQNIYDFYFNVNAHNNVFYNF